MLLSGWELGIWAQCYIVFTRFLIPSLNSSIEKEINRKFWHEGIKSKGVTFFYTFFLDLCCDFRGIYLRRCEALTFILIAVCSVQSSPVGSSWEKMVIGIACELAQNFRTFDSLLKICCFHKKKEREIKLKPSLVSSKQRYFLWKSCMRKESLLWADE